MIFGLPSLEFHSLHRQTLKTLPMPSLLYYFWIDVFASYSQSYLLCSVVCLPSPGNQRELNKIKTSTLPWFLGSLIDHLTLLVDLLIAHGPSSNCPTLLVDLSIVYQATWLTILVD